MKGHGSKFEFKKDEAIAALLTQQSVEHAAKSIDIGVSTLIRWMKDPEFMGEYRAARRAAYSQSVSRLQQASGAAVSMLLKTMVDPNTPASTKVRAADSILDHAAKSIEIEDIEARVAELERAAQGSKGPRQ